LAVALSRCRAPEATLPKISVDNLCSKRGVRPKERHRRQDKKDTEPRITASFHLPMPRQLASWCLQSDESHKGTVSHQSKSSKPVVSSESRRPERLLLNSEPRLLVAEPRRPMSSLRALSVVEARWPMFTSSSINCLCDSLRLVGAPPSLPLALPLRCICTAPEAAAIAASKDLHCSLGRSARSLRHARRPPSRQCAPARP